MNQQANNLSPYTILAFCFAKRARADEVMKELKVAKTFEDNHVVAAAVVEVDEHGKARSSTQAPAWVPRPTSWPARRWR
jgi:hypothetical protein